VTPRGRAWREWLPVVLWALLVAGVLLLPYWRRYADEWHGWRFSGILRDPGDDIAAHLSFVKQARDGWWLFESKSAGAQTAGHRIYNLLFLVMGRAARVAGLSVPAVFHIERTVVAVGVLLLAYWFAAQMFADRRMRWTALILVSTSGGVEWLNRESLGRLGPPHTEFIWHVTSWVLREEVVAGAATGLLVLAILLGRRALRRGGRGAIIGTGVVCFLLASVHPHDIPTVGLVLALLAAYRLATSPRSDRPALWGRALRLVAAGAVGAGPVVVYHVAVVLTDPALDSYRLVSLPWRVPRWPLYFGLTLAMAVVGATAIVRRRERDRAVLLIWILPVAALLATRYPPVQRLHLYEGVHVVLCLLATRGLWAVGRALAPVVPRRRRRTAAVAGLALFATAAAVTNVLTMYHELTPRLPDHPLFLRGDERAALACLDARGADTDVVACVVDVQMRVPMFTPCRSYVGDWDLTPNWHVRRDRMYQLMGRDGPQGPAVVADILKSARADYVYVDAVALKMGAGYLDTLFAETGLADRVFANDWTALYRVNRRAVDVFTPARTAPAPRSGPARSPSGRTRPAGP